MEERFFLKGESRLVQLVLGLAGSMARREPSRSESVQPVAKRICATSVFVRMSVIYSLEIQ